MPTPPTHKLFLSHASADRRYVEAFMDKVLIQGCGLREGSILNTSIRSTGIPTGDSLFSHLRQTADDSPLVVALISPSYLASPTCLAEMGAAWVKRTLFPILTPGMTRGDLVGPLQTLLIEQNDNERDTLIELFDRVEEHFHTAQSAATWDRHLNIWLAAPDRKRLLAAPSKTITESDVRDLNFKLKLANNEVVELTKRVQELATQNLALRALKDADSVREAVRPDSEIEHFRQLRNEAKEAISKVDGGYATADILRQHISGKGINLPRDNDDRADYEAAEAKGFIQIDYEDGTVMLEENAYGVRAALASLRALNSFLDPESLGEDFTTWFESEYKSTLSLTAEKTWRTLLHS